MRPEVYCRFLQSTIDTNAIYLLNLQIVSSTFDQDLE